MQSQQKPVNKFGVVASIKRTAAIPLLSAKSVNVVTQKPVNGLSIGKIGLVDYDSDSESIDKQLNVEEESKTDPAKSGNESIPLKE